MTGPPGRGSRSECARALRLLSDRLDEPLEPADRGLLAGHLERCGPCRDAERGLGALSAASLLLAQRDAQEKVDLRGPVLRRAAPAAPWWMLLVRPQWAASLSVGLAAVLVLTLGLPGTPTLPNPPLLGIDAALPLDMPSGHGLSWLELPSPPSLPPLPSILPTNLVQEVSR